jgi:hypothetical protein
VIGVIGVTGAALPAAVGGGVIGVIGVVPPLPAVSTGGVSPGFDPPASPPQPRTHASGTAPAIHHAVDQHACLFMTISAAPNGCDAKASSRDSSRRACNPRTL